MKPMIIAELAWEKMGGLIPAIVQDAASGAVLMLGYMNREALARSLESGRVTFYSRSRQRLWTKGESSGAFLDLVSIEADCDQDALCIQAQPRGPTCHTGAASCFANAASPPRDMLAALDGIIRERLADGRPESYTARLAKAGLARCAQKVGEEGVEVVIAALAEGVEALTNEAADLVYHLGVLLQLRGLSLAAVAVELDRRMAKPPKS